ncbi:hypothetical protein HPB50_001549 [Hyalomma asiaticum]|uniref:Uncharacterized protein n=1 Tax=Hyalomma asiaticum TaxID=266040 RepID=A0ACB7RSM6_HYAAI|nr:hypothetical protein HPB50_001549 [Hyalomma asiaticum]
MMSAYHPPCSLVQVRHVGTPSGALSVNDEALTRMPLSFFGGGRLDTTMTGRRHTVFIGRNRACFFYAMSSAPLAPPLPFLSVPCHTPVLWSQLYLKFDNYLLASITCDFKAERP